MAGEIKLNSVNFASESGGTITVNNGTIGSSVVFPAGMITNYKASVYTVSAQQTGSTTFTAINGGTETNYTPTTSSGKVVYELTFTYAADASNSNPLGFFYLDDGSEITRTRTEFFGHGLSEEAAFPYYTLRYVIPAYSGSKTLTAKFAAYGGTNQLRLHVAAYSGPLTGGTLTTNVYRTVYTVSE